MCVCVCVCFGTGRNALSMRTAIKTCLYILLTIWGLQLSVITIFIPLKARIKENLKQRS